VIERKIGWLASRFAALSTALKMLLFLSFGLLPLGLIAILASIQSARDNSAEQREDIVARVQLKAQRLNSALSRLVLTTEAASAVIGLTGGDPKACREALRRFERDQPLYGRYAFFAPGNVIACATPGFRPPAVAAPATERSLIEISPDGGTLRYARFGERGELEGYWEVPGEVLARITDLPKATSGDDLELQGGGGRIILRDDFEDGALIRTLDASAPVAGERLRLHIRTGAPPIRAAELLMILLPIIMWIAAAIIGWLIVDRLLLRPLIRMQRAVSSYRPGDRNLALPPLATPAKEITQLGSAFNEVTRTVARHEAELEAAVERQTRLVREVHHRVKNNLQVVASLLNLHARGATSEDVAAAYASIQRRVDALAVVHRNHFAELEENRGVALRSLISELGANLRATAPASAAHMQIRLDIEPYYATQDVAVSVAFLITELVEFAMFCDAPFVAIALDGEGASSARLSISSDSLKGDTPCDERLFERFDRIVTGLSRQLRSSIRRDTERGRYALDIAVLDKGER
jgi:two-component sensor histidine kinase